MEHYHVPGVSVAVFHDFRLAWARGYGIREAGSKQPVTTRTLLQAASIGKPITAAAVLGLVEAGRLSLDADVNTALRSWKLPANEWTRTRAVTPRQLLSHSAGVTVHGFPGYAIGEPTPTLLEILNGQPPANTDPIVVDQEPAQKFRYSGGGYVILQQAIEDVSGGGLGQR
jgi:CubicO group peptidase (beta-lactamase class C family)